MGSLVNGLHHVTAIAGNPVRNHRFYTHVLGLRLVKKTVNFDSPDTYHFYFGDRTGAPGTLLTHFPWGDTVRQGRRGAGMATEVSFAVPVGSLTFWQERMEKYNVLYNKPSTRMGDRYMVILDPDGLKIELVETDKGTLSDWTTDEINAEVAIKRIHAVSLTLKEITATAKVLTEILDFKENGKEVNRYRFVSESSDAYSVIDLIHLPNEEEGFVAGGTIHHVAFRAKNLDDAFLIRNKVQSNRIPISELRDRTYFKSLYFREPGGVLFEIATDEPGFAIDESIENLGKDLKLPNEFEAKREIIEKRLIPIS